MARVDRRKRFNLSDATPVEQRPQIWVDGRQQPRFKIGPYVAVSLAIAKRDLLPDMIAAEARLRLYGERVRHGEVRPNLAWAGRLADAMPQAETVAGWIFSVADVYAGARARLEGGAEEGLGEDGRIAYPGLLKSQARPRKVRPRRAGEATAAAEAAAEAPDRAALDATPSAGNETEAPAELGKAEGAAPPQAAALEPSPPQPLAGDAPLFPEPDFLAEVLAPAASDAPPAPAPEAEAQEAAETGRKAGKRSRRAARMALNDEILAFDMVFQPANDAAAEPAAPQEEAAPPLAAEAPGLAFDTLFETPAAPQEEAAPPLAAEVPGLAFDTLFETPAASAEAEPAALWFDSAAPHGHDAPRLDYGLEETTGFWLADDGAAAFLPLGPQPAPESLPAQAWPTPAPAPAEAGLASLAFDPDLPAEDGLEQAVLWAGLQPGAQGYLADPLPEADLPGEESLAATALAWAETPYGGFGAEVEAAVPADPAALLQAPDAESAEAPSAAPAELSPEAAIRELFAELEAPALATPVEDPAADAPSAEPEVDPDLTAIRLAMGDLLIRATPPMVDSPAHLPVAPAEAPVAASAATPDPAPAPAPAPVVAEAPAAPSLATPAEIPPAPGPVAQEAEALGDPEALAREKTALARMLSGFEELHDPEALSDDGPWGAPNPIQTVIARPVARPRKTPVVVRMGRALARGTARAGRSIGRGIGLAASGLARGSLALSLACGRASWALARGTARALGPVLRPLIAWGGRATHVSACWTLLVLLMATALPGGAVKAMIFHLDGGDLSDWS